MGCLALGNRDSISCPLGPHQHRLLSPGMWGPSVPPGLWDHLPIPGKAVSAGSLASLTYPTTAARPFHCLHTQLLTLLLVPSPHSPPSLGKGCSEQVNSHPGAPSLSCLRGRSAVVAPQLVLPTDPAGVSSFLQLSCPCQGSSPGKQICFSHLSHPLAPSCSPSHARPHPEHRWSTLGKILLKSRRCLWPRRQICVLVRVDSQVHTPSCLFPRAGREWESQQRSEPALWARDGTELSAMLVLLLPPLLRLQHQREWQAASAAGELPPGLHRSGWGVPPEKGPFGMQLSLCTAACRAPRAPR